MKTRSLLQIAAIAAAFLCASCGFSTTDNNTDAAEDPIEGGLIEEPATEESVAVPAGTAEEKVVAEVIKIKSKEEFIDKVCEIDKEKGYRYKGNLPAIVDFYADWCGPCQRLSPILAELADEYKGQILIYKVNTDKCPDLATDFGVNGIPNLIFFHPKKAAKNTVGYMEKAELKEVIDQFLLN